MPPPDAHLAHRRHLPHWRAENAVYFVTWRVHRGQGPLSPEERSAVAQAIRHFNETRYRLIAFVVMDDHVHAIAQPASGYSLQGIVQSWKSFTANRLQRLSRRKGAVWQNEYFDRILRDDAELLEKMNYVLNNPGKRWQLQSSYPWVWALGLE